MKIRCVNLSDVNKDGGYYPDSEGTFCAEGEEKRDCPGCCLICDVILPDKYYNHCDDVNKCTKEV